MHLALPKYVTCPCDKHNVWHEASVTCNKSVTSDKFTNVACIKSVSRWHVLRALYQTPSLVEVSQRWSPPCCVPHLKRPSSKSLLSRLCASSSPPSSSSSSPSCSTTTGSTGTAGNYPGLSTECPESTRNTQKILETSIRIHLIIWKQVHLGKWNTQKCTAKPLLPDPTSPSSSQCKCSFCWFQRFNQVVAHLLFWLYATGLFSFWSPS